MGDRHLSQRRQLLGRLARELDRFVGEKGHAAEPDREPGDERDDEPQLPFDGEIAIAGHPQRLSFSSGAVSASCRSFELIFKLARAAAFTLMRKRIRWSSTTNSITPPRSQNRPISLTVRTLEELTDLKIASRRGGFRRADK